MPFLLPDTNDHARLGGKGAALARLGKLGFEIPLWFAVPEDAAWTREELPAAIATLGSGPFAVRSSGAAEDGAEHSFAGQFASFLEVPAADVGRRIADVRASARHDAVLTYCREHALPPPAKPTVLVQRMVAARDAGVAFSADPVTGRRAVVVISAVAGTGEKLVAGEVDGETWKLDRSDAVLERPKEARLTEDAVREIAVLARHCEAACSKPQDIEWAVDPDGKLWLLQARPVTTLSLTSDPDDTLRIWDNSNIAESYSGVTTPLTFSFARRIYESAYREFCKLMSVPADRIERSDDVFPQMLGLIRGQVYYNLVSWYRVLALLPGFQLNRGFMEQMMGVREPMPDEIVDSILAEIRGSRVSDGIALARTGCGLALQLAGLRRQISRFQMRLNAALAAPEVPISRMSGEELVAHYRDLERQLLRKWDAPLVNDFFAMIFYGVLRSLCAKWLNDSGGTLQNALLLDGGDIISAEPPRRIVKMAGLATSVPGLPELLADPAVAPRDKLAALKQVPELPAAFESYLTDFGDRCLEELKLESPTLRDDPTSLLLSIGTMAGRPPAALAAKAEETSPDPVGQLGFVKQLVFRWVLSQARERVCCRENLRYERTRLFGRVRAIVRALGERLAADGVLGDATDVFYLELSEVLGVWEATGTTAELGALAQQRRTEFADYESAEAPPDRFETRGPVHRHARFENARPPLTAESSLTGTGACPGRVIGRVRVVLDPRAARLEAGEILVARQTDPGWVVLFPTAAGLVVERGSLLSHSAIISRELRLPCIVGMPGITEALKTGDVIEMDGAAGTVRVLES
jgi:phosphohistidine swiveling domain-containing protein